MNIGHQYFHHHERRGRTTKTAIQDHVDPGTKPSQSTVWVAKYSANPAQITKAITPTIPSLNQSGRGKLSFARITHGATMNATAINTSMIKNRNCAIR
jgi:hypothetical protein